MIEKIDEMEPGAGPPQAGRAPSGGGAQRLGGVLERRAEMKDGGHNQSFRTLRRPNRSAIVRVDAKPAARMNGPQEQHVRCVDHRRIRRRAVRRPYRPAIERAQRLISCVHVGESAQPHKAIRIIQVAKLADDAHAQRFLAFDELPVEKCDQRVALSRVERVLAELHHRTAAFDGHDVEAARSPASPETRRNSMTQFVSHVAPPSSENACSQCAECDVICDQM